MKVFFVVLAIALVLFGMSEFLPGLRISLGMHGRLAVMAFICLFVLPAIILSQRLSEDEQNRRF